MARASVWGYGTAMHYKSLDGDQQAELFALYMAHRTEEAKEAGLVVEGSVASIIYKAFSAFNGPSSPTNSTSDLGSAPPAGVPPRRGSPQASEPDILRPGRSPLELVQGLR